VLLVPCPWCDPPRPQVVLHERSETTRVFVRPSFAGYVVDLLLAAR
jgi:sarcosine oxidase delta subunit